MKIAAFALLLSGVLSATLIPSADLRAEMGSGVGKYPWQQAANSRVAVNGQSWNQASTYYGPTRRPVEPTAYRFRPWSGQQPLPYMGRHNQALPPHMQQPPRGYRFRPKPQQQAPVQSVPSSPAVAYRPANITIPDHYVYRPINPVKRAKPRSRVSDIPQNYPPLPHYAYGAYQPMHAVPTAVWPDRTINRAQPTPRYVYGGGYYPRHRFRPDSRVYPAAGYARRPMRSAGPVPGYAYNRWPQPLRYRPVPRYQAPQPGYANLPPSPYPPMVHNYPPGRAPWGHYAAVTPYAYPSWQQRPEWHAESAGKRVNWYDGRSDGEGAWYKLTQQQNWPEVSQNWTGQSEMYSQGLR